MSRRAHHRHWASGKTVERFGTERRLPLCDGDYHLATITDHKEQVSCPKCAAILAAKDLEAWNSDPAKKKLELQPIATDKEKRYLRYAYRAIYGGEHVGYVVYDGAYANGAWKVCRIDIDDDETPLRAGSALDKEKDYHRYNTVQEFVTKDWALLEVPRFYEEQRLETVVTTKQRRAEWKLKREAAEKRQRAEQEADAANLKDSMEALIEIRDTMALSNFQRNGLENALIRLKKLALEAAES